MYFPYIYGRQYELLAIRSILKDARPLDSLVPVIEPVNSSTNDLIRCLEACDAEGQAVIVILNPDKHQLNTPAAREDWKKALLPKLKTFKHVIPGYRCHSTTNYSNVDAFLKAFSDRDTAVFYASSGLRDSDTATLAKRSGIKYHVVLNGKITDAQRDLLPKSKFVDIKDEFNKLDRNADYSGDELFTDRHKTFSKSGVGFGDYAAVGSNFQAGGSTPAAVAIHMVYKKSSTGDIWIEHFVSDDKEKDIGDVASKFVQAAKKLASAVKKRRTEFGNNYALEAYLKHAAQETYPGLGKNKELQIAHHMCLMLDILSGKI